MIKKTTFIATVLLLAACAQNNSTTPATSTSTYSDSAPSGVITTIQSAVSVAGSNMSTTALMAQGTSIHPFLASTDCDTHGEPVISDQSNASYPGTLTYCKMSVNDGSPDTVQGGFQLAKNVSCALEKVGVTFDGVAATKNITVDSTCFSANTQSTPGQSGFAGYLITASGALTTGIKPRLWKATDGASGAPASTADYTPVANWTEVTNTKCYTNASDAASTCGAGLDKFSTNSKFAFTGSHLSPNAYFTALTGQTFTSVNPDNDVE